MKTAHKLAILAISLFSILSCANQAKAQDDPREVSTKYKEKIVYSGPDVVFRQLDDHTWVGNGHLTYNESVYLVEGENRAILIDSGTNIPDLKKIVEGITTKPITFYLTHAHGDHAGPGINDFDEIYLNAAEMTIAKNSLRNYKGKINYLTDGEIIDLGGREIEVIFTPGHTPGSVTFFDKANKYGISGDAFGSTNLLVFTNLATVYATADRIVRYMEHYGIEKLYPGHYDGENIETLQRVKDIKEFSMKLITGELKGERVSDSPRGNNMQFKDRGLRINYNDKTGIIY